MPPSAATVWHATLCPVPRAEAVGRGHSPRNLAQRQDAPRHILFLYHDILDFQAVRAGGILAIQEFSEAKTRAFDGMDIQLVAFSAAIFGLATPVAEKIQIINRNPNMLPFSR